MKTLLAILVSFASGVGFADNTEPIYYAVTVNGHKTGYSWSVGRQDTYEGKPARKSKTYWVNVLTVAGSTLQQTTETTTWDSPDNKPYRETSVYESNGRKMTIDVIYGEKTVEADTVDSSGKKKHKSVPYPDGEVYSDSAKAAQRFAPNAGQKYSYWAFESGSLTFERVEISTIGPATIDVSGKQVTATLSEVKIQGDVAKMYTNSDGDVLREELQLGMVAQEVSKDVALDQSEIRSPAPDVVLQNALVADKRIDDGLHLSELKLRFTGDDLSKAPSALDQTIRQEGDSWVVDVHPPMISQTVSVSIAEGQKGQEVWIEPTADIPADDPTMKALAAKLIHKKKDMLAATLAIKQYVHKIMKPNMGIGLPRDAMEVLQEKEGKCTDYALLTTTLLRAAGIPSRLAVGLLTFDGTFFYHAWSEAWDGKRWIGIDSVADEDQLSASHIKLAAGNADHGFEINYPDASKVRIEVLEVKH